MTLTYSTKRDLVQTFRQVSDLFFNCCDCEHAVRMPLVDDYRLADHNVDCPFRLRVESLSLQTKEGN